MEKRSMAGISGPWVRLPVLECVRDGVGCSGFCGCAWLVVCLGSVWTPVLASVPVGFVLVGFVLVGFVSMGFVVRVVLTGSTGWVALTCSTGLAVWSGPIAAAVWCRVLLACAMLRSLLEIAAGRVAGRRAVGRREPDSSIRNAGCRQGRADERLRLVRHTVSICVGLLNDAMGIHDIYLWKSRSLVSMSMVTVTAHHRVSSKGYA